MNECENSHVWKPASKFLSINRTEQVSDFLTKSIIATLAGLVMSYSASRFVPSLPINREGILFIGIIFGMIFAVVTVYFMDPAKKTKKFLTGVKIFRRVYGTDFLAKDKFSTWQNMGAEFVKNRDNADFTIMFLGNDEYSIETNNEFVIAVTKGKIDMDVISMMMAMAMYIHRKQRD